MKKIILDTNFLLIPIQFKVDIFSEVDKICLFAYKLYIVDKTVDELNDIMEKGNAKDKLAAKIGLQLLKKKKVGVLKTKEGKVDDLILDALGEGILATQDSLLRKRALNRGNKVIFLRAKKYLILTD